MGNQWGTFTFASPNQNVGGHVSPRPLYNLRPCNLQNIIPYQFFYNRIVQLYFSIVYGSLTQHK